MKRAFTNLMLLDGSEHMTPRRGQAVLVDDDRIAAVLPEQDCSLEGFEVIDLGGQYLMPGLINLHVHIPAGGKPSKKPMDAKKSVKLATSNALTRKYIEYMYKSYCRTELLSGVTTFRSVGGIENYDTWIRDRIAAGKAVGPRILAGNMAVSVPGGHMAGSLAYEATTPAEAAAYVRKIAADKPDLIKLMVTGGVLDATVKGEPGVLKMEPALVKSACDEAHRLGFQVAAHVESPQGMRVALENGVDTIEHGAKPDAEIIRLFRETGAVHVATLSPALPYALFDPEVSHVSETERFNGEVVFRGIVDCAKQCLANDIPVGLGTDTGCPYVTHYDMWRELQYFHKCCGVPNSFALYTATKRNAELAGIGDVTGSIQAGRCADFIVCARNPLEDLTVLRNLSMVVARGTVIRDPKIKKMPQVEAELDKFM
ncbi:amidohydrolase family protein [uncultured Acetatifactor sp.]|uniref:amidohydrolase family protein n=1 Tax=uncultured Acetatifactor sp. TaxID=1671927 RepID=UPI00261F33E0|nr:amidohydrolase family protein [uncultured Acetatifactor sp.]MCI8696952.1 amidohydrolase family protein [Lachnospiraceae bacterium]